MSLLKKTSFIRKQLKELRSDEKGNVAIIAAFCMLPCIIAVGGALDVYRVTLAQSELQNATDAAALSAASLKNFTDVESIANEYVQANLSSQSVWESINVEVAESNIEVGNREITLNTTATINSNFLGIIGINETEILAVSTSSQKATKFEISMVLDISSSMRGTKLDNLKAAAKGFVDQVLETDSGFDLVSINLVPYGGAVNIKPIFEDYVTLEADSIVNPNWSQYNIGSRVEDGAFRFTDGLSCIESRYEDYDDALLPANSRAQLSHFYAFGRSLNPWCPHDNTAVVLNTNNADILHDRIDEMTLSDGTGSDLGLLWGTKFLSPHWRGKIGGEFPERPSNYNDGETTKIVVFMTDGGITYQSRPKTPTLGLQRATGWNRQTTVYTGAYTQTSASDTAYGRLKKLCENLDENGVKVFTIGFKIGSTAAAQLQDCSVNGGNYYDVESLNISEAFDAISSSISNLKVTQ